MAKILISWTRTDLKYEPTQEERKKAWLEINKAACVYVKEHKTPPDDRDEIRLAGKIDYRSWKISIEPRKD